MENKFKKLGLLAFLGLNFACNSNIEVINNMRLDDIQNEKVQKKLEDLDSSCRIVINI